MSSEDMSRVAEPMTHILLQNSPIITNSQKSVHFYNLAHLINKTKIESLNVMKRKFGFQKVEKYNLPRLHQKNFHQLITKKYLKRKNCAAWYIKFVKIFECLEKPEKGKVEKKK